MTPAQQMSPTIPAPPPPAPAKVCACDAVYTAEDWLQLRYVGRMSDGEDGELELRDCSACGSTMAIEVTT